MTKILINNTASIVPIVDVGISVPASSSYLIDPQEYGLFSVSNDTITLIGDSTLSVSDGSETLTKAAGCALITGSFRQKEIDFATNLKALDRFKVDITGDINQGDGKVKVSSNDSASGYLVEKIVSSVGFASFNEVNDGLQETIEFTFNQSGILTSSINNDAGFITAAQAPVQDVNGQTGNVIVTKTDVGLGSVPNVDATDADNGVVDPVPNLLPLGGSTQQAIEALQTNIDNINAGTPTHNSLTGLQGGTINEFYHLTQIEYTLLTTGDASSLHNHDTQYYTKILLDGGQLDNRYYTETEVNSLLNGKENSANKGQVNGYASLDSSGKVPSSQIPAIAISEIFTVNNITARDALIIGPNPGEVQTGDIAIVTDASADPEILTGGATYIYDGTAWKLMKTPDGNVLSVNGQTGVVVLTTSNIAEGTNQYFSNERAQDAVGNILTNSSNISFTYNDISNTITANYTGSINDNSDVNVTSPTTGQALVWNGSQFTNQTVSGGGGSDEKTITQTAHGFVITGNIPLPAYVDENDNLVKLAKATSLTTTSAFFITEIIDANSFKIKSSGIVTATAHGLALGNYYYLSVATAGAVTSSPPAAINDLCFYVVDADTLLLVDSRPISSSGGNGSNGFVIKTSNTDITTDINLNAPGIEVPITGASYINESNFYTVVGNGIQVPVQGTYRLHTNIHVAGPATRGNLLIQFAVNGIKVGGISTSGYLRNASSQDETSFSLTELLILNPGDIVTVTSVREAASGLINLASVGTSTLIIESR